jgi:hypothetical protein
MLAASTTRNGGANLIYACTHAEQGGQTFTSDSVHKDLKRQQGQETEMFFFFLWECFLWESQETELSGSGVLFTPLSRRFTLELFPITRIRQTWLVADVACAARWLSPSGNALLVAL